MSDRDHTAAPPSDGIDRRAVLAGLGAGGMAALAGCAGEESNGGDNDSEGDENATPSRPTPPARPDDPNPFDAYVVDMLEYQADLLEAIANDG